MAHLEVATESSNEGSKRSQISLTKYKRGQKTAPSSSGVLSLALCCGTTDMSRVMRLALTVDTVVLILGLVPSKGQ